MDQNLTTTLLLSDGTKAEGYLIGEDETHIHLKLISVYETKEQIWLPYSIRGFAKTDIVSPVNQAIV